jgi:2'-5' RNA ligase
MARTRTFIAVDVNGAIRTAATAVQRTLMKTGAQARWVEAESLHLTLLFLGEVDDNDLARICRVVANVANTEAPFLLTVAGVGAFPTPRRPKVIWGGITDGADALTRLHTAIEAPLLELGCYRTEDRAFTPHLTLGRLKGEEDGNLIAPELSKLADWKGGYTQVEEVLVMSSEMRRNGPEYTVVGRAALMG